MFVRKIVGVIIMLDMLLRAAELEAAAVSDDASESEEERENFNSLNNHVAVAVAVAVAKDKEQQEQTQRRSDTALHDSSYEVQRAKAMKKNRNFFYLHSLLTEMVGHLNQRLGRMPTQIEPMILWSDYVGDDRRKQRDGHGKKISVIDLLSETKAGQYMTIPEKRTVAGKIQKWVKTCRFRYTKKELIGWQRDLLVDLTKKHRVRIL